MNANIKIMEWKDLRFHLHRKNDSYTFKEVLIEFFHDLGFIVTEGRQITERTQTGEITVGSLFIINPFFEEIQEK